MTAYLPGGDSGSAYASYRASDDTLLPVPERSELLPTESRVFGLTFNGQARSYPQEILDGQPVINDSLGGGGLVVVTSEGGEPRAHQRGDREFLTLTSGEGRSSELMLVDDKGINWELGEDALINSTDPSMRPLRLPGRSSFWFGWYAIYPGTGVYPSAR